MKNLFKGAFLIIMIMITQPSQSKSLSRTSGLTNGSETMDAAEAQRLISRLEEIKAMNRSTMTKSERRALRKEVRATEKRLSGGVYLSVGAVIIILLLLILLL